MQKSRPARHLTAWTKGRHNRFEIARKHGPDYQTKEIDFTDEYEAVRWIILNQFGRRNLPAYERARLALRLKPVLADEAEKRKLSALKQNTDTQKSAERKGEVRDALARVAGVSHDTIAKVEKIEAKATPELKAKSRPF